MMGEIDTLLVELRTHERLSGKQQAQHDFDAAERSRIAAFKADINIRVYVAGIEAQRDALLAACMAAHDWVGLDGDSISEPVPSQLKDAIT